MKKRQQTIECGRCGGLRVEFLSVEEIGQLNDATGPIYRQCERCERTTGWISARSRVAMPEPPPSSVQNQPGHGRAAGSRPVKGQERMATQAERDQVNSMVHHNQPDPSKD